MIKIFCLLVINHLLTVLEYMDLDIKGAEKLERMFEKHKLNYFKGPSRFSFFIKEEIKNSKVERSILVTEVIHFDYKKICGKSDKTSNYHIELEIKLEEYQLVPEHEKLLEDSKDYNKKFEEFTKEIANQNLDRLWVEKNKDLDILSSKTLGQNKNVPTLLGLVLKDLLSQNGTNVQKATTFLKGVIKKKGFTTKTIKKTLKPAVCQNKNEFDDSACDVYALSSDKTRREERDKKTGKIETKYTLETYRFLVFKIVGFFDEEKCLGELNLFEAKLQYEKKSSLSLFTKDFASKDKMILNRFNLLEGYLDQDKRDGQVLGKMLRMNFGNEGLFRNPFLWSVVIVVFYISVIVGSLISFEDGHKLKSSKL